MSASLKALLRRSVTHVIRRVSIKRLKTDGTYETEWLDVSNYVVKYGRIVKSFGDSVFLGNMQIEGNTVVLDNTYRKFNDENDERSLFKGFSTRYRTKFKTEVFFFDFEPQDPFVLGVSLLGAGALNSLYPGVEVPAFTFYGVSYGSPSVSGDGNISFNVAAMIKVFQNYASSGIDGSGSPTTQQLLERLVTKTQNGVRIFDHFFEGNNDAERYKLNESGAAVTSISEPLVLQSQTVFNKMVDYSIVDDFFFDVDQSGAFVWKTKSTSSEPVWEFHGAGSINNDYGINIVSIDSERDGLENFWSKIAIEYSESTFATASISWTPGDLSVTDRYGERIFSTQLVELTESEASIVAATLLNRYSSLKKEWEITTIFIPHLEVRDVVLINWIGEPIVADPFILGASKLGTGVLSNYLGSISIINQRAKIIRMEHDCDGLVSKFTLREI